MPLLKHCSSFLFRFIKGFIYRHQPRCPENEYFLDYVRYSFLMKLNRNLPKSVLDKSWPTPPPALAEVLYTTHNPLIGVGWYPRSLEPQALFIWQWSDLEVLTKFCVAVLFQTGIRASAQNVHAEHGMEVLQEHQPRMETPSEFKMSFILFIFFNIHSSLLSHFAHCSFSSSISSILLFKTTDGAENGG